MNFKNIKFFNVAGLDLPKCVLDEELDPHINVQEFKSIALATAFLSGSPENPTAISFVFYFFKGELEKNRKPDDILTFKVKTNATDRVHIIDKYLGGMSFGAENAQPISDLYR